MENACTTSTSKFLNLTEALKKLSLTCPKKLQSLPLNHSDFGSLKKAERVSILGDIKKLDPSNNIPKTHLLTFRLPIPHPIRRQPSHSLAGNSDPSHMATLLSLANETLLQIIDETRPDGIWSFVRCCKRMWILGEEDMEQHRQDVGRYQAPNFWFWDDQSETDLGTYEFLSEVLLRPRCALYVNRISILSRGFTFTQTHRRAFTKKTSIMIDELCGLLFQNIGCPYIQGDEVGKWVRKLRRGDTNAVICLILTLLPNLKSLTIDDYDGQGYPEMIYMISKVNQSPHYTTAGPLPLNKLDTIAINDTRSMTQPDESLGIYEACMTLPSLRKLKGKYIDCTFESWPAEEGLSRVSNVTEIIFDRSAINSESFTRLFMRTKNLQRLTYKFVRLLGISGDYTAMSLKNSLEQHTARTLTHLDLDFNGCALDEDAQFIGSLRQLQVLQHLRIQPNMFIKYGNSREGLIQLVDLLPLLPASIETLTFLFPAEDLPVTFTLDELQMKREECIPNLRAFTCGTTISIVDGLIDECAAVGIELVYA